MSHWILSNFPWKPLLVYVLLPTTAFFWYGLDALSMIMLLGIPGAFICLMVTFIPLETTFSEIIEEILIPEFIEKRPFKEISLKRQEILEDILSSVNKKINYVMGTNYGYTGTNEMVRGYKRIITKFDEIFNEVYKEASIEEIQGWEKILLIAKNIQDEDLSKTYENLVPSELAHKYSKYQQPLEMTADVYELHNIDNSKELQILSRWIVRLLQFLIIE